MGSLLPPPPGMPVIVGDSDKNHQQLLQVLDGKKAFMVWSSNRFGNHDILYLSTSQAGIRQLTRHKHVDYYPRVSPNGTQVVFARSQKQWVSYRNEKPWDVYLLNLETGKERLLAKNGFTPTWSEDGLQVYFQRNGNNVVAYNLKTGKESVLFRAGQGSIPDSALLQTPSYSQKLKQMAVTLRGGHRETSIYGLNDYYHKIGGGCQLAFAPDATYLFHVDGPGRMGNAIYRTPLIGLKTKKWIDLPGEHSHEYFPRVSNDGEFLILGASAGDHPHDSADYEIFIWQIDTPSNRAKRITFHTGNDSWPDLYVYQ